MIPFFKHLNDLLGILNGLMTNFSQAQNNRLLYKETLYTNGHTNGNESACQKHRYDRKELLKANIYNLCLFKTKKKKKKILIFRLYTVYKNYPQTFS